MASKVTATHAIKKLWLPRSVIARFKRTLADLEMERGCAISFNVGAAEALNVFAESHEGRKEQP